MGVSLLTIELDYPDYFSTFTCPMPFMCFYVETFVTDFVERKLRVIGDLDTLARII